jgi:two-component system, chemotaxis family, CheB/CheR fusion protein
MKKRKGDAHGAASPEKRPVKTSQGSPKPEADARALSIVGVGASAGGLEAFEELLAALPKDSGMAFVLVQHLSPTHESVLSQLLGKSTKMPVVEVKDGTKVEGNRVYVIPPNADMSITRGVLHLSSIDPDRARRMPIDVFFRSLAEDRQGRAIGVILSGTASDGTLGLQAIKAVGGVTFAQDDESAKYSGMPRSAVAAGNVDFVLPPPHIARELERIARHADIFAADDQPGAEEDGQPDETLGKILAVLKNKSRVDFSFYKPGTIKRRVTRRMFLLKMDTLSQYLHHLRKTPEEVENLFHDVLINVTGFFRDPEAFRILRVKAFPQVMKDKGPQHPVRIWVPGCATGEEAYSIAILLNEYFDDKTHPVQCQIFATDVSDDIVQKARVALYSESIAADISAERLRRHFQKVHGGYLVNKNLRDMCVFAKHDLAKDPPFSRVDLISCRNVMIYMGHVLQKKIIPGFHYALNEGGILFLGSSETIGTFSDLFDTLDRKHKIYTKKAASTSHHPVFQRYESADTARVEPQATPSAIELRRIADQLLLTRYSPSAVMVDEKLQIVQFFGQAGLFFAPAPGEASLNLLKMVKPGLQLELQAAFQKIRQNGPMRKEGVVVDLGSGLQALNFEIVPLKNLPVKALYYLVIFEEVHRTVPKSLGKATKTKLPNKTAKVKLPPIEAENAQLRDELESTREYLQSIIEEQRTTNEELRSANEEIQSSNEELQSINEELETAKEELQSTNEELTTVNEELQNRNDELFLLNNDLSNLLSSVHIPIIMLGNDLRIRRFTPMAQKVMNLIPTDIGRPITDIKPNVKAPDLRNWISHVLNSLEIVEHEVEDVDGKWYSMRIRPYRTIDNKIDGAVIVMLDLDKRLRPK